MLLRFFGYKTEENLLAQGQKVTYGQNDFFILVILYNLTIRQIVINMKVLNESTQSDTTELRGEKPMRKLVTVKEVSERFSIDKTTLYKWVQSGTIPSVKIGSCVRIPEDKLEELIESQLEPQA